MDRPDTSPGIPASPTEPDPPTERAEFERLDALLASLHPRHRATRRVPVQDTDAPRRLAALWRGIGLSEATVPPGTRIGLGAADSREIVAEVFEEWFDSAPRRDHWGVDEDDHQAAWQRLPGRFRVVSPVAPLSERGAVLREIAVTDESAGGDDPPVVVVPAGGRPLIHWHDSAVQWQVWTVLRRLAAGRSARFDPGSGITGTPVMPRVYPWLEEVADGVWRLREPGLARRDVRPADPDVLLYRTPACYFAFARGLDDARLARMQPPGPGRLIVAPGALDLGGPEFRTVLRERRAPFHTGTEALGRLGGADVWVQHYGEEAVLFCGADDRDAIRQGLARLGGRIVRDETREDGWQA